MIENQLEQLGLHKNEIKVYLDLFDLGKAKAGQLIEQTGLHRNLVYTALEELIIKKLVSKVDHGGVAMFSANSPELIQEMVEDKINIANEVVLELKKKREEQPRDVIIYEGDEGVKRSRNRVLSYDKGDTLYVIGSKASSTSEMEKYWRKFHMKRVDKGIGLKILYEHGVERADLDWRNKLPLSEARYLPLNIDMPVWFSVIKDYLEIGIPGEDTLTFGLRSPAAAGAIQKFFEFFWNQKVATENGVEALQRAIYGMLDELKPGEEYFVLGASVGAGDERVQSLYDKFHTERIKKGVIVNMLAFKEGFKKIMDRFGYCGDPTGKVSRAKAFMSAPPIPMQINIFRNKTLFIIYGDEPTVISFDQPEISGVFKNYFDSLWNQDATSFVGKERVEEAYNSLFALAKKNEDVVIFAAKPRDLDSAEFNIQWAEHLSPLCRKIKYIYYGLTDENKKRAEEVRSRIKNSEVQILNTNQSLPISNVVVGDTTLNTIWSDTPVCLVTKNQMMADSLRENFKLLWEQESQILKGPKALQELWLEMVDYKELRLIGARGYFIDHYPELFKAVEEKTWKIPGAKWKNIVDIGVKGHKITKFPWSETRYNLSTIKNPNVVWLYGGKLAISNWAGDEPVIFTSTNKQLVQSYSDYFDELWKVKK